MLKFKQWKKKRVICIEASAGTGKTTDLAKRYIKLSSSVENLESIFAVTFTNKATNEMKKKVLSILKKGALKLEDDGNNLNEFDAEKLKNLLEKILSNYHNFKISTIDSFIALLARNFSFKFNLPPKPEIILSEENFVKDILREFIEKIEENSEEESQLISYFDRLFSLKYDINWFFFEYLYESFENLLMIERKTGKRIKLEMDDEELKILKEELKREIGLEEDKNFIHKISKFQTKESLINQKIIKFLELYSKIYTYPNLKLYNTMKKYIKKYCTKEGIVSLDFLHRQLKEEILEEKYPLKYIYICEKIKHFLMDEFQDTSRTQWAIIKPIVENTISEGGSFYYVGDKKQAIYEFRGGDYKIFDEIKNMIDKDDIDIEYLRDNYRSKEEIINFVKEVFSEANIERILAKYIKHKDQSIIKHFEEIKNSLAKAEGEGYVKVINFKGNGGDKNEIKEEIKNYLVSLLKEEVLKHFKAEDVTILTRKNDEAREILATLLQNNIQAISPSALGLFSSDKIKEIVVFLNFIANPEDNVWFSSFLLSEIFTKKTNTKKEEWLKFLFYTLLKERKKVAFFAFKENFKNLYKDLISDLILYSKILTAYEITNRFLEKFNVLENFSEEEGFFYSFLDFLLNLQEKNIITIEEVLKEIEKEMENGSAKVIFPQETPHIKVMTIHKAKGLEFSCVLIPYFSLYINYSKLIFYKERENDDFVEPYKLSNEYIGRINLEDIYFNSLKKYLIDELNTWYVALTRAKNALYVINPDYSRIPGYCLLYDKEIEKGKLPERKAEETFTESFKEEKKFEFSQRNPWAERISKEYIDLEIYKNIGRYKKILDGIELHKKIQNGDLTNCPEHFIKILYPPNLIKKEYEKEIVDRDGNAFRADLILHFEREINVIDFKFGEKKKKDLEQIKRYMDLLKEIEKKDVKGFILYFEKGEVVKIND